MPTESGLFYWRLLQHTKQLSQQEQDQLKSKIRRTYENYAGIKMRYKYRKIIESIPSNVKTCITFEGTKLLTPFPVKDRTKFEHKYNIVYFSRCPNVTCNETYVEETNRRIKECIMDRNKRDKSSHLLKHAWESQHIHVWNGNFKILNGNYKSNIKTKISEVLYIRALKSTLNVKEKSVRLELHN